MPYEEEDLGWGEPEPSLDRLTGAIIGAAIEVHKQLGAGLDEALYEVALARELTDRQIPFERQVSVPVNYKGSIIGRKQLDFIADGKVVIELKAVAELGPLHLAQVKTYLKITNLRLGLLINFNVTVLRNGIKRIIFHS